MIAAHSQVRSIELEDDVFVLLRHLRALPGRAIFALAASGSLSMYM